MALVGLVLVVVGLVGLVPMAHKIKLKGLVAPILVAP
jgi:hypothetical protein